MTTRRGPGALTTILMLIPMLAVPVMALFGVPHFMPVVASPTPTTQLEPFVGFLEPGTGQSDTVLRPVSLRMESEDVDLFQPYGGEAVPENRSIRAGSQIEQIRNTWSDPLDSSRSANTARNRATGPATMAPAENGLSPGLVTIFDSRPSGRDSQVRATSGTSTSSRYERPGTPATAPARPAGNQSITWRQASQMLNELGVQTYSLTPGLTPGEFRFVCLVSSADDPRVSRRFESNSLDPLIAVEQVITQVKSWTQTEGR